MAVVLQTSGQFVFALAGNSSVKPNSLSPNQIHKTRQLIGTDVGLFGEPVTDAES